MRIDGKLLASSIVTTLREEVSVLKIKGIIPHLAVILVGNDPASVAYVNQKKLKGESIGMQVSVQNYIEHVTTEELILVIKKLNKDNNTHGIIVQQPLPSHIEAHKITEATDPKKDVDGFHPHSSFTPPIAEAVEEILKTVAAEKNEVFKDWIKTQSIVVIGKGETGGAPIIERMKKLGVAPTVIDSRTEHPQSVKKSADIIISCVGKEGVVKPEDLKPGVILLSIGMYRGKDSKLHGDYEEDVIKNIASYYTPVPGGVGPVNVAMLLKNLIDAAEASPN
ncbi:MAG: bifunctional 5,10-methylenetetrahydrofolate dehydrogenase/5,10-methenyltetrahydrofolate cyclohydrolase [bacterium]|nr:bifunctional 5,10-methylenetetrahydrofolate dehydrogenase/5,10-methenyltetrahydrofolate cyclohydrolase [bacterium]